MAATEETRVSKHRRRCAHPQCQEVIPPGEEYVQIEREAYHLECGRIRRDELDRADA